MGLYRCTVCEVGKRGDRLPPGWKSVAGTVYCKDDFRKSFVVRAVTLPVACPVGGQMWEELNAALSAAFRLSTDLANWSVADLFKLDAPTPKAPEAVAKWYGYGRAKESYPDFAKWAGAKGALNIIVRGVQRKYMQQRFDVMLRHAHNLVTYRYPYPFPVDADDWRAGYEPGDFPAVDITLPGQEAFRLRLKRRADFGRQLAMFRQLHSGEATRGEAALYRKGGDLMLKMVGWFRRRERGPADNAALVCTDPGALLVVEINGHKVSVSNGDHMRREIARHKTMLRRTGQDKKREKRMDRRQRGNLEKHVAARCRKQRSRLDDYVKQAAAQVARLCERRGVGLVLYDDARREFMPDGFPWHALKTRLRALLVGEMACDWVDEKFAHITDEKEKTEWLRLAQATAAAGRRAVASRSRKGSHPKVSTSPTPTSRRGSARR